MKVRPLQLGILILGAIAVIVSVGYFVFGGDEAQVKHELTLVDVATGQIYVASTSRRPLIEPVRHPETGEISLVRIAKNDTGTWFVTPRALPQLDELPVNPEVIDEDSGEVLKPSSDIKRYPTK